MERTPVPEVFFGALDFEDESLGEWYQRINPTLTYEICRFIVPWLWSENMWTRRKVEYEASKRFDLGKKDPVLMGCVGSVVDGLIKKGILVSPSGLILRSATRNTEFNLGSSDTNMAKAYYYAAELAMTANVDPGEIQGLYARARQVLERV